MKIVSVIWCSLLVGIDRPKSINSVPNIAPTKAKQSLQEQGLHRASGEKTEALVQWQFE